MKTTTAAMPLTRSVRTAALLMLLCFLLLLTGCGAGAAKNKSPVQALQCAHPVSLSGICPVGNTRAAVCGADYENSTTTLQIIDVSADTVCEEVTLDGTWELRPQTFSGGSLALCDRETSTWKFLDASLKELGVWQTENADGVLSYDGDIYYYLSDHVLFQQDTDTGETHRVALSPDLRLLDILAYNAASGQMAVQFFLSPYGSECGTAILDTATGQVTMLRKDRYQAAFTGDGLCLLSFDTDSMGYSALYGSGDAFCFADAGIFLDTGSDLYPLAGSPYLMSVATGSSTLYAMGPQISACPLESCGIPGEMFTACFLPDAALLVGLVYQNGTSQLYTMDPAQLSFTDVAKAAPAASPLTVDDSLAQAYWNAANGVPVAETLQEARQYADTLEETYGVRILLSSQCREAAALCDRTITLTDTIDAAEELNGIRTALDALARTFTLYPEGFLSQFRNGMGEGGLRFLLVESIESNYSAVACTYENGDWQNIALDIRMADALDGTICHEIWHATENHILTRDYAALPPETWDALNPEGFSYYEDATLQDPAQKWTLYSGSLEEIHFVDSYACVDAREDRARIMEFFMTHEDEAELLIQSPFIRQKLQLMCDAIRNNFDTSGWLNVRWERLMESVRRPDMG